jgi:serine protease inhibitor
MNRYYTLFLIMAILITANGCGRDFSVTERPETREYSSPVHLSKAAQQVVASGNQFSFNLFQETVRQEGDKNVFISPLSASIALAMAYNGANAATESAMRTMLGFTDLSRSEINESYQTLYNVLTKLDSKVSLKIANAIWYHRTFSVLPEFARLNQTYFNAQVSAADFQDPATVGLINAWCDQSTNGRIKNILDKLQPNDVMALLNAIYFKGTWTYEFDKTQTIDDYFIMTDGSRTACKMMRVESTVPYFETSDMAAVDLPYGKGHFSMTLLLPKGTKTVDDLIRQCTAAQWIEWSRLFQNSKGTVMLPKLKLEYEIQMNTILSNLGMAVAFNPSQADFSNISKTDPLYITMVKQKTFLQVDEEGTEAAAVTGITFGVTSVGPSHGFFFRADRPFVLVIRDHATDSILFVARIMKP